MHFFWRLVPSRELLAAHNLRWLVISRFFADLFFYSTTIVLFQAQRGLNFTEMFAMESILSAAIWLADIPTSLWADRFGYRGLVILGRACGVVGLMIFALAHGFWMFALDNLLAGLAIACVSGCEDALIYGALTREQRANQASSAFALLRLASSAAFFVGLFTGSFIGAYSPTLAVVASILPAALSLLAALRLRAGTPREFQASPEKERLRFSEIVRTALRTIRRQPALVGLSLFESATFALINAIFWYNQPYFERAGIPVLLFGPLMAAAMGLKTLLLLRLDTLLRRMGTRVMLALSCLLPGMAYVLLGVMMGVGGGTAIDGGGKPSALLVVILVAIVVAFAAWREPLVDTELNRRIEDGARATTLSALSLLGSLMGIALNPLIGRAGDLGLETTGVGMGIALLVLGAIVPLLVAGKRDDEKGRAVE